MTVSAVNVEQDHQWPLEKFKSNNKLFKSVGTLVGSMSSTRKNYAQFMARCATDARKWIILLQKFIVVGPNSHGDKSRSLMMKIQMSFFTMNYVRDPTTTKANAVIVENQWRFLCLNMYFWRLERFRAILYHFDSIFLVRSNILNKSRNRW